MVNDEPIKDDHANGIEQRAVFRLSDMGPAYMVVKPGQRTGVYFISFFINMITTQRNRAIMRGRNPLRKKMNRAFLPNTSKKRLHAPFTYLNSIKKIQTKHQYGEACSIKYIGARPYFLLMREHHIPGITGEDQNATCVSTGEPAYRSSFLLLNI